MSGDIHAVILAGGQGSRFWPISRAAFPKQFLELKEGGHSMITKTALRVKPLVGDDDVLVVTNELHRELVSSHVPTASMICEPCARNTAPAIALAAMQLLREGKDPAMVVLPADHAIENEDVFCKLVEHASKLAHETDSLITIGITPHVAHTGYGYIKRSEHIDDMTAAVDSFVEKPSLENAKKFLADGSYLWNSGMFVWKASVLIEEIRKHLPELHEGLMLIDEKLKADPNASFSDLFEKLPSISIDFGIMEKAEKVLVVEGAGLGWSDVGAWDSWSEHFKADSNSNISVGESITLDSSGCVIYAKGKLTATIGLKDVVIIDSEDALLVCTKDRVQEVKEIVNRLKKDNRKDLL